MAKIIIKSGESITIEFEDSDGDIIVAFDKDAIRVKTDWPDTTNRSGIIYEEVFVNLDEVDKGFMK